MTGNKYVGGLVGSNWGNETASATIDKSYSTGAVEGRTGEATDLGGLVGKTIYGYVRRSYWDTETSRQDFSDGGASMDTSHMKQKEFYIEWNFAITWDIGGGKNNGYPFLRDILDNPEAAAILYRIYDNYN